MDSGTIAYYDAHSAALADFYESHRPSRIHELIAVYFKADDTLTIDIGCGSGRDAEHLHSKDYRVIGVDALDAP